MTDKHIFLIGPMGAGKSTIGVSLAERLKRPFFDMDQMIVERTGRNIPEIFADDGECNFRALEGQMLAELCAGKERHFLPMVKSWLWCMGVRNIVLGCWIWKAERFPC